MTEGAAGQGAGDGSHFVGTAYPLNGLLAAARMILSPTTWLALIHLLAGLIIGIVSAVVLVTGLSVGLSLVPVFGLGVVVLVATFWIGGQSARAERARFAFLLGEQIPAPLPAKPGAQGWRGMWRAARRPEIWKNLAYGLIRLPLSVLEAAPVIAVWSGAFVLLTLPAYNAALPGGAAHIGSFRLGGPWWPALGAVLGAMLLLAAPLLTRALAAVDASIARWLIGSAGRAELTARISELETSRARVIDAAEAERMRIERDLHDGAQQRLVSLAIELGRAKAKFSSDPDAAAAIVGQAHEQAKEALAELRRLVRGVHPPVLSDRGLDAALSGLAALSPVPVSVRVDLSARPSAAAEAIAYFVVAEALTNVAKHAKASHVGVTVCNSGNQLKLMISDDGIGGADPGGQGLSGLAARVAGMDGQLRVTSPAGGPTSIEVALPCGS